MLQQTVFGGWLAREQERTTPALAVALDLFRRTGVEQIGRSTGADAGRCPWTGLAEEQLEPAGVREIQEAELHMLHPETSKARAPPARRGQFQRERDAVESTADSTIVSAFRLANSRSGSST